VACLRLHGRRPTPPHGIARRGVAAVAAALAILAWISGPAAARDPPQRIAAVLTLSGPSATVGLDALAGVRMAFDEARRQAPGVELAVIDDGGDAEAARAAARRVAAGDALAVIGPSLSTVALAVEAIYAEAGLAVVAPNIATDETAGIFRLNLGQSRVGEAIADYLRRALGGRRAAVLYSDDALGRPFALGFRRGAERLGITATYHPASGAEEITAAARRVAGDPARPAIVLGMLETAAVPALKVLKRADVPGPFLATASFAYGGYARLFAAEPEERTIPGFFTDGVYAAAPVLLDSGNAALLRFVERYRREHGHEPSWRVVLAYDATRMLLGALAPALRGGVPADTPARRRAVREAIAALDGPSQAIAGLSGPIWFDPARGRPSVVRMARFERDLLESAPLQLVPVAKPDPAEILAGTVVSVADGRFARFQRVAYAGIHLNEIARLDVPQSSFTADFYLWLRSAAGSLRPGEANPTEIQFPDLRRGDFDPALPAVRRDLPDGSVYRLWHVRGEFRNEFDLRRFPFDRQTVALRLFNARAASDRIIYALDRRAAAVAHPSPASTPEAPDAGSGGGHTLPSVGPAAFRGLTQWDALWAEARRDVLVTPSALGDPLLIGAERVRELSGFRFEVGLRRRTGATLAKSLLPIGLMTLMMFASLWFPPALVRDKVAVAITGALSGAVLLAAINSQLGNVAYTMDVEYAFYVFFALALLCILSVSVAERLRVTRRERAALLTERATRLVFFLAVCATAAAGWLAATR
jgi:ABC-type branched-subunit amino acid transport system substrate-binding protein